MADVQARKSIHNMLVRKSIRNMPIDLWKRVRILAFERHSTVEKIIIAALERYLATEKG